MRCFTFHPVKMGANDMSFLSNHSERVSLVEFRHDMTLAEKKDLLVNSLLQAGDLNELSDNLAILIDFPILLLTPSYSVIACSRIHNVTDSVWNHAVTEGYYPDFVISYIVKNHREWDISHQRQELFERSLPYSENKRLICNMWHQGEQIGSIAVLISEMEPNGDDRELILFARDLIQKILALGGSKTAKIETPQEFLLIEILGGKIPNRDAHYSRFLLDNINDPGYFLLINIEFQAPKESKDFVNTFRILFPQATTFVYTNRLLIFFAQHTPIEISESFFATLEELLSSCNAIAYISDMYENLFHTREHYCKNVRIGKLTAITKETKRVVFYNDYRFIDMYYLAANSIGRFKVETFVCRKAHEIYRYDKNHKTEYIDTLWNYLNAGESASGAAKMMYLHKNTIAYRISRIKELFQLDLSHYESNFQIYYSCCILRFHDRLQNNGDVSWKELDWDYDTVM